MQYTHDSPFFLLACLLACRDDAADASSARVAWRRARRRGGGGVAAQVAARSRRRRASIGKYLYLLLQKIFARHQPLTFVSACLPACLQGRRCRRHQRSRGVEEGAEARRRGGVAAQVAARSRRRVSTPLQKIFSIHPRLTFVSACLPACLQGRRCRRQQRSCGVEEGAAVRRRGGCGSAGGREE